MIQTTPFHERTSALNETGLWEHWSNHLAAVRYQMSDKSEYFAIRNAAGLFDSSPLYKYRIHRPTRSGSWPESARIEAGLVLLDVDFHSNRFAWTDADRTTPIELGLGWMVRDVATTDREFIGRDAIRRELPAASARASADPFRAALRGMQPMSPRRLLRARCRPILA